jgi:hypothetical protein
MTAAKCADPLSAALIEFKLFCDELDGDISDRISFCSARKATLSFNRKACRSSLSRNPIRLSLGLG